MSYSDLTQNRDVRKSFLLTTDLNYRLQAVAEKKHVSQNELVNKAIDAYLKRFN